MNPFEAQRLFISETACCSIAFRLIPIRFSVTSVRTLSNQLVFTVSNLSGNHETGGVWKQGGLDDDLVDLQAVVDYLKQTYGYVMELVVGHSRGSVVAFRWISTTEDGRRVSAFVNASGRYRMAVRVTNFLTCRIYFI